MTQVEEDEEVVTATEELAMPAQEPPKRKAKKVRSAKSCECSDGPKPVSFKIIALKGFNIGQYCSECMEILTWAVFTEPNEKQGTIAPEPATPKEKIEKKTKVVEMGKEPKPVSELPKLKSTAVEAPVIALVQTPIAEAAAIPEKAEEPAKPIQEVYMIQKVMPVLSKPDHMAIVMRNPKTAQLFQITVPSTKEKVDKAIQVPGTIDGKYGLIEFLKHDGNGNPVAPVLKQIFSSPEKVPYTLTIID